ncbi:MAG: DEAD/DEAH box helicase [Campylobacteraceae bacterium]|jgi:hypothetical protein|nr:DEAD/DEAH box helicase [Campylobacteraceae bacterium]
MNTELKKIFTNIGKVNYFQSTFKKLILNKSLTSDEKVYILACAILFGREYEKDRTRKSFLEIAYYIILKYSTTYNDYEPLYDMSFNFGYYPISNFILKHNLLELNNASDFLSSKNINLYKNPLEEFIETKEQNNVRRAVLQDSTDEISFIAPTSYGKSLIIKEHIFKNKDNYNKIGIIVPSKSLLNQTYKLIKELGLGYRLIVYDDMYQNDEKFIGILTQERALRLLEKESLLSFDVLYIDEAHSLLEKDPRSILLCRLLKQNEIRNNNQHVIYLSPLVDDSNNLKRTASQRINKHKIEYNIKEPEYFEYRLDNAIHKYSRFTNQFYEMGKETSFMEYIVKNSSNKTFIFHRRPIKVEQFAKELAKKLDDIEMTDEIQSLIDVLIKYVHKDFYIINLIKKGIIYLHAKLPDQIKDYLEHKFKTISQLKFIVANEVILEGINLPISSMFILYVYKISEKRLTNLIGRVNRLNYVFDSNNSNLKLLCPQIHFVNSKEYASNTSMANKIQKLRSKEFNDYIENPLLEAYEIDKIVGNDKKRKEQLQKENRNIKTTEEFILKSPTTEADKLKQAMIKSGVVAFYDKIDNKFINEILKRIKAVSSQTDWIDKNILSKLYEIFLKDIENVKDFEVSRLQEEATRNYYTLFIQNNKNPLSQVIAKQMKYFKSIQDDTSKNTFYFGQSYGEVPRYSEKYPVSKMKTYVNLKTKTDTELINLVIVKIKMEEDFVSFTLNNFFNLMLGENLITENEYNQTIYGTTDTQKISLIKIGLPMNVLELLEKDNQLQNILLDKNKNFVTNDDFNKYKKTLDEFTQFKIDKFL